MRSSCSEVSVGYSRRIAACGLAALAGLAVALATGCAGPPGDEPEVSTATAALQFAININGVSLTKQSLVVTGFPVFDSKTVQTLQLSTGTTYVLSSAGGFIRGLHRWLRRPVGMLERSAADQRAGRRQRQDVLAAVPV